MATLSWARDVWAVHTTLTVRCWQSKSVNSWLDDNAHWRLRSVCCICETDGKINLNEIYFSINLLLINFFHYRLRLLYVSRARWSCLWRRTCGVKTAKRGRNSSLTVVLNILWYVCSTILFWKLLCLLNWIWWLLFIFIFKRPIIIGWGRDTRMILWPVWNLIRICGWRFDRQVDPIKIGFTGSPTLRPITYGRSIML